MITGYCHCHGSLRDSRTRLYRLGLKRFASEIRLYSCQMQRFQFCRCGREKPASNLPLTGKSDFTNMNRILDTLALQLLRGYKWAISPIFPPACRYVPTCSEYAMEAVDRYGALRGSLMAGWRLLRCHPFSKGGYDPVVQCSQTNAATGPVRRTKDAFT